MVFHFKYSTEGLEQRSRAFGRLTLITLLLLIVVISLGNVGTGQETNVGWDYRDTSTTVDLADIYTKDANTSYAVGDDGVILFTEDNGQTWEEQDTPVDTALTAIDMHNDTYFVSGEETVLSKNTTSNWIEVNSPTSASINSVDVVRSNTMADTTVFIAGDGGEIWKTVDGGQSWLEQNSQTSEDILSIHFFNSTYGLAVGTNGLIVGTFDGGSTWEIRNSPEEITTQTLRDVYFYSDVRAFIVGDNGLFLRSDTSETTITFIWKVWDTGTTSQLNALYASSTTKIFLVGDNGTIVQTKDGGNLFKEQKLSSEGDGIDLTGISMADGFNGYIVGSNGLVLFTDREGVAEADLPSVKDYSDFAVYLDQALPLLFEGFINMLRVIFISMFIGFVLGIGFALAKTVDNVPLNFIATVYTDFFRNTPLLVQIFVIHFGFPELGIDLTFGGLISRDFASSIVSLGLNSGAYQAEIIRSGIQAIPTGQMEAGRSVGLTYIDSMRYVILPQAIRVVIPPLGNEFVNLILNSSLVSLAGYLELTRAGRLIIATTFLNFQTWLIVALFYFVVTYTLTNLLRYAEKKTKIPGLGLGER